MFHKTNSEWIQIAVIIVCVFIFYKTFIKNTAAEKLVHGLVGIFMLWVVSFVMTWLNFDLLAGFLHWFALFLSVGLVVVFQPELRKFLALMGDVKLFRMIISSKALRNAADKDKTNHAVEEILKAVEYMSVKHTGALIVLKDHLDDDTIERTGTMINADISSELLLTIFFNKTPLHDGAVFIGNNKIISAGAILPLSQKAGLNWKYGTRHRAALGMSEATNSVVLIVSEETGDISIVEHGVIKKYDTIKKLKTKLESSINK